MAQATYHVAGRDTHHTRSDCQTLLVESQFGILPVRTESTPTGKLCCNCEKQDGPNPVIREF